MAGALANDILNHSVESTENQTIINHRAGYITRIRVEIIPVDASGAITPVTGDDRKGESSLLTSRLIWDILVKKDLGRQSDARGLTSARLESALALMEPGMRGDRWRISDPVTADKAESIPVAPAPEEESNMGVGHEEEAFAIPRAQKLSLVVAGSGLVAALVSLGLGGNSTIAVGAIVGFTGLYVASLLSAWAIRRALDEPR